MVCKWPHVNHILLLPAKSIQWLFWFQRKTNCILHSVRDIILLFAKKLTSNWGVTVDDIQASTKAKFSRNKYMGMWRWGSLQMRAIRPRFPTMVRRYITKNRKNRGICPSGWYVSPVRVNSVSNVAFSFPCPHWVLPEMKWSKPEIKTQRIFNLSKWEWELK